MIKHLLMWCPFIGFYLIAEVPFTWVENYLFRERHAVVNVILVMWQSAFTGMAITSGLLWGLSIIKEML